MLGICLGAQLVARGHGAKNILGRPVEFGWHEVRPTEAGRRRSAHRRASATAAPLFHWHTRHLHPAARRRASRRSDRTDIQAFRVGRAVYGIQFHFEADRNWSKAGAAISPTMIAEHDPDWPGRHPAETPATARQADAAGRALARAWVA